ncbi:hypothetical protein BROUX41_001977 [Berkeleyomyces rouxiae]|uniref:uncharacterized protein n=1 Tax=Berkeleyomyces rouxiae TaxID=2035830 RepID=UPI003B7CE0C0
MSDNGYSSGEERYQADIRRAIALSAKSCPLEPEGPSDHGQRNHRSDFPGRNGRKTARALPAHVAAALFSANLATPSAMVASKVASGPAGASTAGPAPPGVGARESAAAGVVSTGTDVSFQVPVLSQFGAMMLDRKRMEEERLARARLRSGTPPVPIKRSRDEAELDVGVKEEPVTRRIKLENGPALVKKEDEVGVRPVVDIESDEEEPVATSSCTREPVTIVLDSDSEPDATPKKEAKTEENDFVMSTMKLSEAHSAVNPKQEPADRAHFSSMATAKLKDDKQKSCSSSGLPFPHGTVKKTWLRGHPQTDDVITIQQVMQKDKLIMGVVSSFQWEEGFLMQNINISRTKLFLVVHAASNDQRSEYEFSKPNDNVRYIYPPIARRGIMHSKLMILKFASYLRIVVPTANFVSYDWGSTGAMENHVFLIDLPLQQEPLEDASPGPFEHSLTRFLLLSKLPEGLVSSLKKYDFSAANKYRFVYSANGSHRGQDRDLAGFCGLANAVKSLGLATSNPVEVDIVSSSVGKLNIDFLSKIYTSCRGYLLSDRRVVQDGVEKETTGSLTDHMRFYFPSLKTVEASLNGTSGAGTICLSSQWFADKTFPSDIFRDCVSVRSRSLMHSKIFFVRNKTDTGTKAWAYVGSGNLSQSAWGRISVPKTAEPSMTCDNWECGVVLAVGEDVGTGLGGGVAPLDMFQKQVPVPFDVEKAVPYKGSQLKPWCMW